MYEQIDKTKESKGRAAANVATQKNDNKQSLWLMDNRPESIIQRQISSQINPSGFNIVPETHKYDIKSMEQDKDIFKRNMNDNAELKYEGDLKVTNDAGMSVSADPIMLQIRHELVCLATEISLGLKIIKEENSFVSDPNYPLAFNEDDALSARSNWQSDTVEGLLEHIIQLELLTNLMDSEGLSEDKATLIEFTSTVRQQVEQITKVKMHGTNCAAENDLRMYTHMLLELIAGTIFRFMNLQDTKFETIESLDKEVTQQRSNCMFANAYLFTRQNQNPIVWKIGKEHVDDMQNMRPLNAPDNVNILQSGIWENL